MKPSEKAVVGLGLTAIAVQVAIWALLIYVAVHFITKWW